jgi:acetyl esterase/lipase
MTDDPRLVIAASVSPEARATIEPLGQLFAATPRQPVPTSQADFDRAAAGAAAMQEQWTALAVAALAPDTRLDMIGNIPVLDVRARDAEDDGTLLLYVHGGGFVQGSAQASLLMAALMAHRTKRRVVSIDYTLSPRADYRTITDQIAAVHAALVASGRPAESIGMFGESAGGAIVASAILKLRDRGVRMPAAALLMSPVTDLHAAGDTHVTIADHDFLGGAYLRAVYRAYAPEADFAEPYASPLFGDFSLGFPPVLIQVGTREVLLSDSVRLNRAIRAVGGCSLLDVYDGMPHVFQQMVPDAPEGRQAWDEIAAFWSTWLVPADTGATATAR